ncbi:MAG: hypothetical protein RR755_00655 [Erysipelotrichaceae bacterium]
MKETFDVNRCIQDVLIPYAECIAWGDFSDKGNPCYDPYVFDSPADEEDAALTYAAVLITMAKGSDEHIILAKKVARILGNQYVTYDWLAKAVGRVLSGSTYTYDELLSMSLLSKKVRDGMKAKGLTEIHSIQAALG